MLFSQTGTYAVRAAIHVQSREEAGRAFSFSTGLNYTFTLYDIVGNYSSTLAPNLRILQYSGDADPCVPYIGTERWIASMGFPGPESVGGRHLLSGSAFPKLASCVA